MFRHPSEIKSLLQRANPDSVLLEAEADLPNSLEVLLEADGADVVGPSFETEGWIRESSSGFETSGSVILGRRNREETHELSIEERDRDFALKGSHILPADSHIAALVVSQESLVGTLTSGLTSISPSLGSQLTVDVESHEFQRHDGELDAEYVARLDGLGKTGSTDRNGSLSVKEATVDVSRGKETACSWGFDLQNHRNLFCEVLADRGYQRAYELSELRRELGFGVESQWSAESSGGNVSIEVSYDAEKASAYINELLRRNIETPARTSFNVSLNTRRSSTSVSFELETDGDLSAGPGKRLESWVGFVPLPLAPLVSYIS